VPKDVQTTPFDLVILHHSPRLKPQRLWRPCPSQHTTRYTQLVLASCVLCLALVLLAAQLGCTETLGMDHQNPCLMSRVVEVLAHPSLHPVLCCQRLSQVPSASIVRHDFPLALISATNNDSVDWCECPQCSETSRDSIPGLAVKCDMAQF